MATLIARLIVNVRQLPGLADARAIVVAESNVIVLAGMISEDLRNQPLATNFEVLNLDQAAQTRPREDGSGRDESGLFYPGLRTSKKNKFQTAILTNHLLTKRRIYWHQHACCYSLPQPLYEHSLTKNQFDLTHTILWRQLYPTFDAPMPSYIRSIQDVFQYHQRELVTKAVFQQFSNVSYRPTTKIAANGDRITKYSITGKIKDGDKDDLYMAFGINLLGAVYFYRDDTDGRY